MTRREGAELKLRVLVTTYNHEAFVAQALESVMSQRTDFDFDVVIMDDCSTDRTPVILDAWQRRSPTRIRVRLAAVNRNDNAALMEEFLAAPSRYLAWIDGDDYWTSPWKLQRQVDFLDANPDCVLCYHNALKVFDDGQPPRAYCQPQKQFSTIDDLLDAWSIPGSSPMFRAGVLDELPSWFRDERWSDWAMYLLYAEHGRIGYLDDVMSVYRVHQRGMWSSLSKAEQDRTELAFYQALPTRFGSRYGAVARAKCAEIERLLEADDERVRMNERHRVRKVHGSTVEANDRLREVVHDTVPGRGIAVVITEGDANLLPRGDVTAWQFCPVEGKRPSYGRLLAEGREGRYTVRGIADGAAWELRLYVAGHPAALLSAATVVGGDGGWAAVTAVDAARPTAPFLIADPNPVALDRVGGHSEIVWAAGDDVAAKLYLSSVRRVDDYLPHDGSVAVAYLGALQDQGATHLVLPDTANWWLSAFPEFGDHLDRNCRLLVDEEVCKVYALL